MEQFSPEDLKVKLKGDSLLISAKHEAKSDEYGVVSREFSREFSLPEVSRTYRNKEKKSESIA